jgi:hypothetical protein
MAALTAAVAHHRAKVAALERCVRNGERAPDDPELANARRDLAATRLAETAERIVAAAPPMTDEQVDAVVAIIRADRGAT